MPAIKFDEQQRAKGLRELILHGDVYCLPDHIFIVPLDSLRFLDKANISYTFVDGEMNQTFLLERKTKSSVSEANTFKSQRLPSLSLTDVRTSTL